MDADEAVAQEWVNALVEDGMNRGLLPQSGGLLVAVTDGVHVLDVEVTLETVELQPNGSGVVSADVTMRKQRMSDFVE